MAVVMTPRPAGMKGLVPFKVLQDALLELTLGQLQDIAILLERRQREVYPHVADIIRGVVRSILDPEILRLELPFMALAFGHMKVFVFHPGTAEVYEVGQGAWNFWADRDTRQVVDTGRVPCPLDFSVLGAFDRGFAGCQILIERASLKVWSMKRDKAAAERFARYLVQLPGRLRKEPFFVAMRLRYPYLGTRQILRIWRDVATLLMKRPGRPDIDEVIAKIDPQSFPG